MHLPIQRDLTETEAAEYLTLASLIYMRQEMYAQHRPPPQ
jgi:hypothetical protein